MDQKYAVVGKGKRVIETFDSQGVAERFAKDFRAIFHGPLPMVMSVAEPIKPGDRYEAN
jgi:hypothetical protein